MTKTTTNQKDIMEWRKKLSFHFAKILINRRIKTEIKGKWTAHSVNKSWFSILKTLVPDLPRQEAIALFCLIYWT